MKVHRDERIGRAVEGLLSEEAWAVFQQEVICNRELRAAYVEALWLHHALRAARVDLAGWDSQTAAVETCFPFKPFRELAVLVARHHLTIHQALALQPDALLDLLEGLDGLRRPARFEDILLACLIDFTAQLDSPDAPYPQALRLRGALAKIRALDIAALARQHAAGPALKDAIRRARIERLTQDQDDDANPVILD